MPRYICFICRSYFSFIFSLPGVPIVFFSLTWGQCTFYHILITQRIEPLFFFFKALPLMLQSQWMLSTYLLHIFLPLTSLPCTLGLQLLLHIPSLQISPLLWYNSLSMDLLSYGTQGQNLKFVHIWKYFSYVLTYVCITCIAVCLSIKDSQLLSFKSLIYCPTQYPIWPVKILFLCGSIFSAWAAYIISLSYFQFKYFVCN